MGIFDDELSMSSRPTGSPLERIPLDTWISREAALYALRMIQGQRLHGRLVGRDGIRDAEILTLIGLAERNGVAAR